jgi:hypothetical protein
MQYLLSVHSTEDDFSRVGTDPDDIARMYAQVAGFNAELQASGSWVFAGGLQAASTATVVKSADGAVAITDGPYLEAREHLGGFWVIDVQDLDAALKVAGMASAACENPVEVRPFQEIPSEA